MIKLQQLTAVETKKLYVISSLMEREYPDNSIGINKSDGNIMLIITDGNGKLSSLNIDLSEMRQKNFSYNWIRDEIIGLNTVFNRNDTNCSICDNLFKAGNIFTCPECKKMCCVACIRQFMKSEIENHDNYIHDNYSDTINIRICCFCNLREDIPLKNL